ncbi:MAG: hypothetical protein V1816_06875 [Pseudomonadota bacterium]
MAGPKNPGILVMRNNAEGALPLLNHLHARGLEATPCGCDGQGLELLKKGKYPLVITEARAADSGPETPDPVKAIMSIAPQATVLVTSDAGFGPAAAGAIRNGAYDYIVPGANGRRLETTIDRALDREALAGKVRAFRGAALGLAASAPAWFALGLLLAALAT